MATQQKNPPKTQSVTSPRNTPGKPNMSAGIKPAGMLAESLLIVVVALGLYANTLGHGFVLDDMMMITHNTFTKEGFIGIGKILTNDAFTGFHGENKNLLPGGRYRPLSQMMFAVEYGLFGDNPLPGHLLNILLYALGCFLLYKALDALFKGRFKGLWRFSFAFVITLLFTMHPLHTEGVANIKGRDEILTLIGFALLLWLSMKYSADNRKIWLLWMIPVFLLSMLSKESAITFLAAIPVILIFREQRITQKVWTVMLYLGFGLAAYMIWRFAAIGFPSAHAVNNELLNNPFLLATFPQKIATLLFTWMKYVVLVFFPQPLTHDYYPWHITYKTFGNPVVLLSMIFFLGGVILSIRKIRKPDLPVLGFLLFIILFSSQSNLLVNIGTFMNERFIFLALLGIILIIGWLLMVWLPKKLPGLPALPLVLAGLLVVGFSLKTISRNRAWKDDFTLFSTDVEISSNSAKVNTSAGGMLLEKAQKSTDENQKQILLSKALPYLRKAVSLHPTYMQAKVLLGNALLLQNDFNGAWEQYGECLRMSPGYSDAFANTKALGSRALMYRDYPTGLKIYRELCQMYPKEKEFAMGYSEALLYSPDADLSQPVLDSLARLYPNDSRVQHLLGQLWGRVRAGNPAVPPAIRAVYLEKSRSYIEKAISLDTGNYGMIENLGIVYGMAGNFNMALKYFGKALELMTKEQYDQTDAMLVSQRRENLYRLHKNIGDTYRNMGRRQEMEEYYRKAGAFSSGPASSSGN
jgi:protein O-mannosyl-transferase